MKGSVKSSVRCPICDFFPCQCPSGSGDDSDNDSSSAVELLVFKPNSSISANERGVHENLWIKKRFEKYVSIGVYLEQESLMYYFFKDCDDNPKIYNSLIELKKDLPSELENLFERKPKLFIMGHGGVGYGLSNIHGDDEVIHDRNFDKLITDFEAVLPEEQDEIFITLEACNTDNRMLAKSEKDGSGKTFLERVSENHPSITFSGTGPWNANDAQTGNRASGGFPELTAPVTAIGGGIWKNGNTVIFYHSNHQIALKKPTFSSTKTAAELKINTVNYACEVLKHTSIPDETAEEIIIKICLNRDIIKIEDLTKINDFPQLKTSVKEAQKLIEKESKIVDQERNNYISRVEKILAKLDSDENVTERDILVIALGLKHPVIFENHKDLRSEILNNKNLLSLVMVSCGKVLIADASNDQLIDLLLEKGVSIHSTDEKGMTALHYAAQNFYNYRAEPIKLVEKLLKSGANTKVENKIGQTPIMIAENHIKKSTVMNGERLLNSLKENCPAPTSLRFFDGQNVKEEQEQSLTPRVDLKI